MAKMTIKQLAALADLSPATISLALRKSPKIAPDTRARVLALAQERGYIYNRGAALLRTKAFTTAAICLNTVENPVFSGFFSAIQRFFWARGWMVMFADTEDSVEMQTEFISRVMEYNVAGLVVVPAAGTRRTDLEHFAGHIPVVLASRELEGSILDQVKIEYASGVIAAVDHLVSLGHSAIGWLGGGTDTATSRQGFHAYRDTVRRHGIELQPHWIHPCAPTRRDGDRGMRLLLERAAELTAVLCFGDLLASGAMAALQGMGMVPGRDMSVIGFDDLEEAAYMNPPLTSVRIDLPLMGEMAGRLLLNRIQDRRLPRQEVAIPVQLVIRETTARPL